MVSDWTIDTLREHFDQIMAERDRAVTKLADEMAARFAGTNQWRETVMEIQAKGVTRATFDTALEGLRRELTAINLSIEAKYNERQRITAEMGSDLRSIRDTFTDFKVSTDQRFHQVNEFRAAMSDQQDTYLPKTTWDTGHELLRSAVEQQRLSLVTQEGAVRKMQSDIMAEIGALRARMIGAVAAVSAVMAVVVALVAILRINA